VTIIFSDTEYLQQIWQMEVTKHYAMKAYGGVDE
jgi:hypothetical protein